MTGICKVCLKTVKISDKAILCDHYDHWIHIKCDNIDKLDYEMLKTTTDPYSVFLSLRTFYLSANDIEKNQIKRNRNKSFSP